MLLLAASPLGRGRLVDAAGVLPVLAAVAPSVLSGTDTANVVELADPLEPQAVLTRLRAAAASPGPLTVYVSGQLQLDRRQRLPHLALARTTAATVRYTALPWHWIREELRLRSADRTALVVDLHADAEAWRHVVERGLDCGPSTAVYGRVAPPGRRGVAEPSYMKAVATLLRSGHRPPLETLHQQALGRVAEEIAGNLVLGGAGGFALGAAPGSVPGSVADSLPRPASGAVSGAVSGFAPGSAPGFTADPAAGSASGYVPRPAAGSSPGSAAGPAHGSVPGLAQSPVPGSTDRSTPGSSDRSAPGSSARSAPNSSVRSAAGSAVDAHAAISAAVRAGRHGEADTIAARHELAAVRAHGPASEDALHWSEVRADLAMFAGDAARSCRAWLDVAGVRLAAGQSVDAPAVEAAVDRAHHQWGRIEDAARARELGPALAELRLRVPGRRSGALENVQRQLRQLQTQ
ncbi:hypothetical protein GCM10010503_34030 [Streptomyces lucensis JCM 4490]|uniref:Uncharacterized protein n=1 Tax=Streptomyces lucensis JCM 4490 TaxID=1306176 RepID=A0A918J747_9ACTN|nr:hypothetical protein GCM10010503_34030 [Streptomyces lucensis JCM 4490]